MHIRQLFFVQSSAFEIFCLLENSIYVHINGKNAALSEYAIPQCTHNTNADIIQKSFFFSTNFLATQPRSEIQKCT